MGREAYDEVKTVWLNLLSDTTQYHTPLSLIPATCFENNVSLIMRGPDVRENGLIWTQVYYWDCGCGEIKTTTATKQNKFPTGNGRQTYLHRRRYLQYCPFRSAGLWTGWWWSCEGTARVAAFLCVTIRARKGEPAPPRIVLSAYCWHFNLQNVKVN